MEASVADPTAEHAKVQAAEQDTRPDEPVAATAEATKMFTFAEYIHVGRGAALCELAGEARCVHIEEGGKAVNIAERCEDPEHFHAFCRLPNKLQQKDIREKGQAAKARKARALADPESDSHTILESELLELREADDKLLIDELVQLSWTRDYLAAVQEVDDEEQWEHIDQDRERYSALLEQQEGIPEEEQSEETQQLRTQIGAYIDATEERLKQIQGPQRDALAAKGHEGLVELIREKRIDQICDREFVHVYRTWTWFVGTLDVKPNPALGRPQVRRWGSPEEMHDERQEVIDAIEVIFNDLELSLQKGSRGNS